MMKKAFILGQSVTIGVLTLTLILTVYSYNAIKQDRNDWADFITGAWTECEYECEACINRFAYQWEYYEGTLDNRDISFQ